MIIYSEKCMACTHKQQWRNIRQLARKRGENIVERRAIRGSVWAEEAGRYNFPMPFMVIGDKAVDINKPLDELEKL